MGLTQDQVNEIKNKGADKVKLGDGSTAGDALLQVSASIMKVVNANSKTTNFNNYAKELKDVVKTSNTATIQSKMGDIKTQLPPTSELTSIKDNLTKQKTAKAIRAELSADFLSTGYIVFLGAKEGEPNFKIANAEQSKLVTWARANAGNELLTFSTIQTMYGLTKDQTAPNDKIKTHVSEVISKATDQQKSIILGKHIGSKLGTDVLPFICVTESGKTYLYFPTVAEDKVTSTISNFNTKLGLTFSTATAPAQPIQGELTALAD